MKFPRLHLFEFEDLSWLPKQWRAYITDLLCYQIRTFGIYSAAIPKLQALLKEQQCTQIIDLCSGSGGPLISIIEALNTDGNHYQAWLSDKYPNLEAWKQIQHPAVQPICESVDAKNVPTSLVGCKTIFTAFHHFGPDDAKKILSDAFEKRSPIAIFEITERTWASLLTLLIAPIAALLCTPFVKPRKLSRFFWTYIVPVVPLLYTWDGLVSNLRTYTLQEWQTMATAYTDEEYSWEIGVLPSKYHTKLAYLIGKPKSLSSCLQ